jgi:DNA-directed RNA polymerase specialized sigma24 family protein
MLFSKILRSTTEPCSRSIRVSHVDLTAEGMSDGVLLAGFGAQDPRLAVAFVRRFQRVVFGIALGVVGDAGMAEVLARQAFEHAWRCAESYDVRCGPVRTWLADIAHNLAVEAVRVRPERCALASESTTQLCRTLAELPTEQARAVVMAAVHGMTAREIADVEDIPVDTAKSRIRAGMTQLHSLLPAQRDHP